MGSLSQIEEYAGALLRGHLSAGKGIGRIGLIEAVENTDYSLHSLILRWFFEFGGTLIIRETASGARPRP